MSNIGFVSTLHDADGLMAEFLGQCMPEFMKLYEFFVVVATSSTSQRTIDVLGEHKAKVFQDGKEHIGLSRRMAVERGLEHAGVDYLHYCDLDRLIHWNLNYPDELKAIVTQKIQQTDFLVIGRTAEAFESHPQALKQTESVTNSVLSSILGRKMDVAAGSCGMSRAAAEKIVESSTELTNATDAEWPMLIHCRTNGELGLDFVEINGLEFENPTFFGADAIELSNTTENWLQRATLCRASVEAAIRVSAEVGK